MNHVMIAGNVRRGQTPLVGAIVHLRAILGTSSRSARGGFAPLRIIPRPRVNTVTDDQGIFVIYLGLPDITAALASGGRLRYRIAVTEQVGQSPAPGILDRIRGIDRGTVTYSGRSVIREGHLHMVVSLRAIANGAGMQPDPRDISSFGSDFARSYAELRGLCRRLPMIGFTIAPPSPTFLELAGFITVDFVRGVS